jgi:hypothetical protein
MIEGPVMQISGRHVDSAECIGDHRRIWAILFRSFSFISPKVLDYLAFQFVDLERIRWWLFQKRNVRTSEPQTPGIVHQFNLTP